MNGHLPTLKATGRKPVCCTPRWIFEWNWTRLPGVMQHKDGTLFQLARTTSGDLIEVPYQPALGEKHQPVVSDWKPTPKLLKRILTTGVSIKREVKAPQEPWLNCVDFRLHGQADVHQFQCTDKEVYTTLIDSLRSHEHPVRYAIEHVGAADWFNQYHQPQEK